MMGFQGQNGSHNLMLPQNQIQQSTITGQGFQDAFSSSSNQSGFSNASLPDDLLKVKPHGLGTPGGSSSGACSTRIDDNKRSFASGSVRASQVPEFTHVISGYLEVSCSEIIFQVSPKGNAHYRFSADRNFQRNHHGSFNKDYSQRRQVFCFKFENILIKIL